MLRIDHEDSKYVAVLYNYEKEMATKYREYSAFLYMDDKANVPIGMLTLPLTLALSLSFSLYTYISKLSEYLYLFLR